MSPESNILCIGECMVELSPVAPRSWQQGFAGDTMNTAWYLRQLFDQTWKIEYFTAVGTDLLSDEMLAFFEQSGISINNVIRVQDAQPGLYMIHLKEGERSFSYWREQSAAKRLATNTDLLARVIAQNEIVYFSGITLAILPEQDRETLLHLLQKARMNGQQIVFDPNIRPRLWETPFQMKLMIEKAAAISNLVLPSFADEQEVFYDRDGHATADRYLNLGCDEAVVKNGGGPILYKSRTGKIKDITLERVLPRDTTGAGDSFNAGFIHSRRMGMTAEDAITSAHEIASYVVLQPGAISLLPLNWSRKEKT
ncbi:sugar kinase [Thalassospira lucentensis]|uniref:sugar kinase n=1 Tax=Thalassospira lucentensis TaxID=168935 RepID=UPI0003B38803|nr:sugar kinase [Thalassospira lucentensis]